MKLERLISMIYMLLNNEVISASALAERYGVSQRTIYRDIEAIGAAGIPVVSYQGANGGYGIIDSYKMDRSLLNAYDAESLITVLNGLATVFKDDKALDTVRKLQTIQRDTADPVLNVELGGHPAYHALLQKLRSAIQGCRVVRFEYYSWKNERTFRTVEPACLTYRHQAWYLHGFCRERQSLREFRLSRMSALTVADETFVRRADMPIDRGSSGDYEREAVDYGDSDRDIVIRFTGSSLPRVLDLFNNRGEIERREGEMIVKLRSIFEPWLMQALLMFGEDAEVLEPTALRERMKAKIGRMLKRYE